MLHRSFTLSILFLCSFALAQTPAPLHPPFHWQLSPPLVSPEKRQIDPSYAEKDPTIIFDQGRWHLWVTTKCPTYTGMEYLSFDDWQNADRAPRHIIKMHDKYACAPQVFFFTPQKKWYMIYQRGGYSDRGLKLQVVYSTTTTIADPSSWTLPQVLFTERDPEGVKEWIDFWVICDNTTAYLFFTGDDGLMWRSSTPMDQFPKGFSSAQLALKGDIFEASHTYRLKHSGKYLTLIEAIGKTGRRYYKAYLADRLDGKWLPLADSEKDAFASASNITPAPGQGLWADNISHGELIRDSNDQTLTVDEDHLQFLFQGCLESEKRGKTYYQYPWRLGLLTLKSAKAPSNR